MSTKTVIPKNTRKEINEDPSYKVCMLYGYHDHVCGGRITKEHTIIFAGKSYQAKWSIISLCARGHGVDEFQDNHEMKKDLNVWIALNRALPEELQAISKALDYSTLKTRLNSKYGVWYQKNFQVMAKDPKDQEMANVMTDLAHFPQKNVEKDPEKPKKDWFRVMPDDMLLIKDIQAYLLSQDDYHMPYPDVIRMAIRKMHDAVMELKASIDINR